MAKIGLFYGSDTGNTENIFIKLHETLGEENADLYDFGKEDPDKVSEYEYIILGAPTWYDGELQSDWEEVLPAFEEDIDFTGKKVAIIGLGDQWGYAEWFVDAIGRIAKIVKEKGGELHGKWSIKGYEFDASVAQEGEYFLGLALDEDNQPELTEERLGKWLPEVIKDFGLEINL